MTATTMSTMAGFEVHTEARGLHWIGWVTRAGSDKPEQSIVLVAASQEEAESHARAWAEKLR